MTLPDQVNRAETWQRDYGVVASQLGVARRRIIELEAEVEQLQSRVAELEEFKRWIRHGSPMRTVEPEEEARLTGGYPWG